MTGIRIGLLTVSDRAASGVYEDLGGPAMRAHLDGRIVSPRQFVARVVPDDPALVASALVDLADAEGCHLVVTTGGTGPAPRDVTPEATEAVCDRMLPGFGEAMRAVSRPTVPTAILSRQTAGTRGGCLIVNLPGRPAAIAQCLDAVLPAVPDCIALLGGPMVEMTPDTGASPTHA
ncbi:MAG: molybdenum cofactor biosynthesis [Actinomycetota bacterium]